MDYFKSNPLTQLEPNHPTTSFSANQLIQFARAIGLEVSLAPYSMLEKLLVKAVVRGGVHPMVSRYLA